MARFSSRLAYLRQSYVVAPLPQHNSLWWFGLLRVRSPLLAESSFLSSPPGTEMFHFPGFARTRLSFHRAVMQHYLHWVSPFGYLRIIAWLAAPRSFSQLPASFIASYRLGIHRVPLVAWSLVSSQSLPYAKTKVQLDISSTLPDEKLSHSSFSLFTCAYALVKDLVVLPTKLVTVPHECLVEPNGIEPLTSSLQSWRSTN